MTGAGRYVEAVGREMDILLGGGRPAPRTIYFGGGTPSILADDELDQLCRTVSGRVSLSSLEEWTVEANPVTLSPSKLKMLKTSGVNRISIGVQSFDDRILKTIGRRHSAGDISETVRAVRAAGFSNVGLDLIACLPGVDDRLWKRTLEETMRLEPQHVSVYALTVENGTKLEKLVKEGRITISRDEDVLRTLDMTEDMLARNGYRRYEISNYARNGLECRHNLSFWHGEDYLGFGPAASSRDGRVRRTNVPDTGRYVLSLCSGAQPPHDEETLPEETNASERFAFAFRLSDGVDLDLFCARYTVPEDVRKRWERALETLAGEGVVEHKQSAWSLTSNGRQLADYVAAELLVPVGSS
jgi:oxygen-independent coproporphyrinogen-3 oxidase